MSLSYKLTFLQNYAKLLILDGRVDVALQLENRYVYGESFEMDFKTNTIYHKECTYNSFDLEWEASLSPLLLASLYISWKNPEKGWKLQPTNRTS